MFSNFKNSVIYAQEKTTQSLKKEIAIFGSLKETTICHFFKASFTGGQLRMFISADQSQ